MAFPCFVNRRSFYIFIFTEMVCTGRGLVCAPGLSNALMPWILKQFSKFKKQVIDVSKLVFII